MKAIIGKKVGMSQIFDENGHVIPVTVIEAGPCTVVQKKTEEKDGYNAVQLGYQDVPERKLTKPEVGHLKKAGEGVLKKVLKEFKLEGSENFNVGDIIDCSMFTEGDRVLLNALHTKLMANKKLASMAKTSDPQIFAESIFPKAFGDAAQDSYMEAQDTYTALFEDQAKYNAIMRALAEVIYREMRTL